MTEMLYKKALAEFEPVLTGLNPEAARRRENAFRYGFLDAVSRNNKSRASIYFLHKKVPSEERESCSEAYEMGREAARNRRN